MNKINIIKVLSLLLVMQGNVMQAMDNQPFRYATGRSPHDIRTVDSSEIGRSNWGFGTYGGKRAIRSSNVGAGEDFREIMTEGLEKGEVIDYNFRIIKNQEEMDKAILDYAKAIKLAQKDKRWQLANQFAQKLNQDIQRQAIPLFKKANDLVVNELGIPLSQSFQSPFTSLETVVSFARKKAQEDPSVEELIPQIRDAYTAYRIKRDILDAQLRNWQEAQQDIIYEYFNRLETESAQSISPSLLERVKESFYRSHRLDEPNFNAIL